MWGERNLLWTDFHESSRFYPSSKQHAQATLLCFPGTAVPFLWPASKYSILLPCLRTEASNFLPQNLLLSIPLLSLHFRWECYPVPAWDSFWPVALIQPFSAHPFQRISSSPVNKVSSTSSSILIHSVPDTDMLRTAFCWKILYLLQFFLLSRSPSCHTSIHTFYQYLLNNLYVLGNRGHLCSMVAYKLKAEKEKGYTFNIVKIKIVRFKRRSFNMAG